MKSFSILSLVAIALSSRSFAADGPEIFVTRYLATGMEESFIIACPGTKPTCQMRGTTDGAPPMPYPIPRSRVEALASGFQGRVGDTVPEKKAGELEDPGHEKAAVAWRVRFGGKVSQGILERDEPKDGPAKAKYDKSRKAVLNLESDLRQIQDAQIAKEAKSAKKKK